MTMVPSGGDIELDPWVNDDGSVVGLEDLTPADLIIPNIKLDHAAGEFVSSTTGERWNPIEVILLQMVPQRLMFEDGVFGEAPLCKSNDAKIGRPGDRFPVAKSGFTPEQVATGTLTCGGCNWKEWGTHPDPKVSGPYCSEVKAFAGLILDDEGNAFPGIFQFQKTGIRPVKQYVSDFKARNSPLFTVKTTIKLELNRKGSVTYSTPTFIKGPKTDAGMHTGYARQARAMRDYLLTRGVRGTEENADEADEAILTTEPEPVKARPATAAPAAPGPTVADIVDDDEPF